METISNRRRHVRLQRDDKLFIQVLAASESPSLVGETLQCSTLDVSESGVRVEISCEVPVLSEIDLWIDVKACAQKYFMHGLVKWCYEADPEKPLFQIGIELLAVPFTDFDDWQAMFAGVDTVSHFDRKR